MIRVYHDPGFAAPIGKHIMPMHKFQLVADGVRAMGLFDIQPPRPATIDELLRVHTPEYINAVRTGEPRWLAETQKFPWSKDLFPSVTLTNGGVIAAAHEALANGCSAALASGFHHSHSDHGEGFCTFNGLVAAADDLRCARPGIRVAVLDLDLHYGNGTAALAKTRPWLTAISIYGNDYVDNQSYCDVEHVRHADGPNHFSRYLKNRSGRAELDEALDWALNQLELAQPDILLYQAGADPFQDDPYSPLDLDTSDLQARDERVFNWCKSHALPVAWVLAGGYTPDVTKVVEIHLNTALAAQRVFGKPAHSQLPVNRSDSQSRAIPAV